MKKKSSSLPGRLRIGILGGGQLARMLCLRGWELGHSMKVLSEHESDPAAQVTRYWHQGSPNRPDDLRAFAREVDVLTFESEFFEARLLQKLSADTPELQIHPSPQAMGTLQDRWPQKEALVTAGLPTAPFMLVSSADDFLAAKKNFPKGFVLKKRTHGYDGYGTHVFRQARRAEWQTAWANELWIAESFVPFQRELALLYTRSTNGSFVSFPLVESLQREHRCDWVVGPLRHKRLRAFSKKVQTFLQRLNYCGTIAFELFDTGTELLVNEVAPRVHNSGHYTQNACYKDQFHYHLLAITGEKLLPVRLLTPAFCMVNLIGNGRSNLQFPTGHESYLHWYGKAESRRGRKMGHLNLLGTKAEALRAQGLRERRAVKI